MLDTEGIDAWDQTGQYSVQIFSLAVLLSSLFVYNQMGGIDEAALDRLSLVTKMTQHIRVRAANNGALHSAACVCSTLVTLACSLMCRHPCELLRHDSGMLGTTECDTRRLHATRMHP